MSVTFSFPGMPIQREEIECAYCYEGEDCMTCGGTGVEEIDMPVHYVNWSNTNARILFTILKIEHDELVGEILQSDFPRVLQESIRLLNGKGLDKLVSEVISETITVGKIIFCGSDKESWMNRVECLQKLIIVARDAGQNVYFS